MDTYREYAIRCRTCNMQIAAFASTYEELLNSGYSVEEALNTLSYYEGCCRENHLNIFTDVIIRTWLKSVLKFH